VRHVPGSHQAPADYLSRFPLSSPVLEQDSSWGRVCDRAAPGNSGEPAETEPLRPRSQVPLETRPQRGQRPDVASATSGDEEAPDWPPGGQKTEAPVERERAGKGERKENGGGGGEPKEEERDGDKDIGGGPQWPGSGGTRTQRNSARPEAGETSPDRREDLHRASHDPGGSWLYK
ncbi:hypothetical protein NDU88_003728, partial [Pleurodeles waltl]